MDDGSLWSHKGPPGSEHPSVGLSLNCTKSLFSPDPSIVLPTSFSDVPVVTDGFVFGALIGQPSFCRSVVSEHVEKISLCSITTPLSGVPTV